MNDRFTLIRAVRGPVILLTLGVLFLLDQQSSIPFWRTWPLLLIIFGVFKLAERTLAPPVILPAAPPPPQQGGYYP